MIFVATKLAIYIAMISQLSQIMCSTGYSSQQIGMPTALTMFSGMVGGIVVGILARKWKFPVNILKITYCISSITLIASLLLLREPHLFFPTLFLLIIFSFCAIGCLPLSLELAAEEMFPLEPVYAETCCHFPAHAYAFVLIILCNSLTQEPSKAIEHMCGEGIRPWDYTPYFYLLMTEVTVSSCLMLFFINPYLKRQEYEEK